MLLNPLRQLSQLGLQVLHHLLWLLHSLLFDLIHDCFRHCAAVDSQDVTTRADKAHLLLCEQIAIYPQGQLNVFEGLIPCSLHYGSGSRSWHDAGHSCTVEWMTAGYRKGGRVGRRGGGEAGVSETMGRAPAGPPGLAWVRHGSESYLPVVNAVLNLLVSVPGLCPFSRSFLFPSVLSSYTVQARYSVSHISVRFA